MHLKVKRINVQDDPLPSRLPVSKTLYQFQLAMKIPHTQCTLGYLVHSFEIVIVILYYRMLGHALDGP